MPIYEYKCAKCDHLEEVLQKFSDPPPNPCPECGAKKSMKKEVSMTSFQLKGGGWYSDLYGSVPKEGKGGGDKEGGSDKKDGAKKEGGESSPATTGKGDSGSSGKKESSGKSDKKPKKKATGGKSAS